MKVLSKIIRPYLVISLCFSAFLCFGQNNALENGNINDQFNFVFDESESYRDFKVIKKSKLTKLRSNIKDSISLIRSDLSNAKKEIAQSSNNLNSLKNSLTESESNLAHAKKEKDSFSFLGVLINKTLYNVIMWALIAGLLACTIFFIYQFRNSHVVTSKTQSSLQDVNNKFDDYKKKTLVKEQSLMRELQDFKNKYK